MHSFYQIPGFLAMALLLAVLLRCRQRLSLPLMLVGAPLLVMIGGLWGFAQDAIGAERLQAALLSAFPDANDPDGQTVTRYLIGEIKIGPVYWIVMTLCGLVSSLGWLLFGIGLLQFTIRRGRDRHFTRFSSNADHV